MTELKHSLWHFKLWPLNSYKYMLHLTELLPPPVRCMTKTTYPWAGEAYVCVSHVYQNVYIGRNVYVLRYAKGHKKYSIDAKAIWHYLKKWCCSIIWYMPNTHCIWNLLTMNKKHTRHVWPLCQAMCQPFRYEHISVIIDMFPMA